MAEIEMQYRVDYRVVMYSNRKGGRAMAENQGSTERPRQAQQGHGSPQTNQTVLGIQAVL